MIVLKLPIYLEIIFIFKQIHSFHISQQIKTINLVHNPILHQLLLSDILLNQSTEMHLTIINYH